MSAKTKPRPPSSSPPDRKKERLPSPHPPSTSQTDLTDLFSDSEDPNHDQSQIPDHNSNCDTNGQEYPTTPPVSDDLISALQHLEASASSDAAVRERIAKLSPELSDVATVEKEVTEDQAREQLE